MPAIEERVAYLEGRVEEQTRTTDGLREAVVSLERRMDVRFETVDRRFEAVDRRFENIERRLDGLDEKMTRYFVWLVGVQVTTLAAIVAAFTSRG